MKSPLATTVSSPQDPGLNLGTSLEARGVLKRFGDVTAVDGVSFTVSKGEVFSLLGPSGCGKSTLLNIIAGLETMDEGDVLMEGIRVNDVPPYRRNCTMVFQSLALFPHMSVEDNVAFGLERRGVPRQEMRKRVGEMLDMVRLAGVERRRPAQLSGGQQQRVAIARSLVLRPALLLLDEPLASLDRKLRKEMQVELKRIQKEVNVTFLYVTHDQKEALCLSHRVGVMKAGRLVQVGTPTEIYQNPRSRFVADFLGVSNIFPGKIAALQPDGERMYVDTPDGFRLAVPFSPGRPPGSPVDVAVRPEVIEVLRPGAPQEGENLFPGVVEDAVYQGEFTEVMVGLGPSGRTVTAHVAARGEGWVPGSPVSVRWDWQACGIMDA
jgi:spermidine/putrescine ABC transporter ATP-binding subunit